MPPVVTLANVILAPTQTTEGPVIEAADGNGFTVTKRVESEVPQLLVKEYVMRAVPTALPRTAPEVLTDAIAGALLDHVPPDVALLSVVTAPIHTVGVPVTGPDEGSGFTVNVRVVSLEPQPLVTV